MGLYDQAFDIKKADEYGNTVTLSGFIPGSKPDEINLEAKNELAGLMQACGYGTVRTMPSGFVACSMLGKRDSSGKPLYSVEDVLNPSLHVAEKKEIFQEILSNLRKASAKEKPDAVAQAKLDTELAYGAKRLLRDFNTKYEKILADGDMSKLTDTKLIVQSYLIPEMIGNFGESAIIANRMNALEEKGIIGAPEETVKFTELNDGPANMHQAFVMDMRIAQTNVLRWDPSTDKEYMLSLLTLSGITFDLKRRVDEGASVDTFKKKDFDKAYSEPDNGKDGINYLRGISFDDIDDGTAELPAETIRFAKSFSSYVKKLNKNPILKLGANSMMQQGIFFRNVVTKYDTTNPERIAAYTYDVPTTKEMIQAYVNSSLQIYSFENVVKQDELIKEMTLGGPIENEFKDVPNANLPAIRALYDSIYPKFMKSLEELRELDNIPTDSSESLIARKTLLERVRQEIIEIQEPWVKSPLIHKNKKGAGVIARSESVLRRQIESCNRYINLANHGISLPLAKDETASSAHSFERRKTQLDSCLKELKKLESVTKTSVSWKRMMSALEMAIESNVKNPKNQSMVMLDESLQILRLATTAYLNHKANHGNDYKDFEKIRVAKKLQSLATTERELTAKAVKEMALTSEPELDNPLSATLLNTKQKLFAEFKTILSGTKTTTHGSSPEFDKMVTALSELSDICRANEDTVRHTEGHNLSEENKVEYATKVSEALKKVNDYLKHKDDVNNGSKTSMKRIVVARVAYRYLYGLNTFAKKVLEADAAKKNAGLIKKDEERGMLLEAAEEANQIFQAEDAKRNIGLMENAAAQARDVLVDYVREANKLQNAGFKEEAGTILNQKQVKDALKTLYVHAIFHEQVKAERQKRNIHDEDDLLGQNMPTVYTAVREGRLDEITEKIAANDVAFKENFGSNITLDKLKAIIMDHSLDVMARNALAAANNDPKFEDIAQPVKKAAQAGIPQA